MAEENSEFIQLKAGLKAFFRIADFWQLTLEQSKTILGNPPISLFQEWKAGNIKEEHVSVDILDRLSYILGIFKALKIMHSDENHRLFLVNGTKVALFNNKSPLDYMLNGHIEALANMRLYLDR